MSDKIKAAYKEKRGWEENRKPAIVILSERLVELEERVRDLEGTIRKESNHEK